MTFIVLHVYTFINVFIVSMFTFYQYKNHKSSQILDTGYEKLLPNTKVDKICIHVIYKLCMLEKCTS